MILSDRQIVRAVASGKLTITPFSRKSLNPSGYDLRISSDLQLGSKSSTLVATMERLAMPSDLGGTLHLRSSLAREGVVASLALVDPGFRGQLTILLFNAGVESIRLRKAERFLQIVFHTLGAAPSRHYGGRYQNSHGVVKSRRGRP